MKPIKHLDVKTTELAGVSASIAGGCRPCFDYHFKRALEVGCTIEQIKEAIELGKMIKQRPIKNLNEHADRLINNKL
jgi:AhpD family alkylhydroperoxidase